ncbi:MAG: recombinase family protein [Firmicutes bacterium HGW-Firmicutes-1]|nr:MAG: recombinase family protein [Firmicutes bacterium HGW-Firmicutes-1]
MNIIEKIRLKKQVVRAVIYARFSSDNQREESIEAQLRAIKDYANKNNLIVVNEYIDKAKSATTDNRPQFLQMIADSKEEIFDLVLVHKLDRFARNRQDSIGYRMELKRHGVSLISVLEYLDDESPESLILESILEAMAEYYSKNLAREVHKGMKENALKGQHTGGHPPLGYDVNPQTKMLVINPKEAEVVKLIFNLYTQGKGYGAVIDELNLRNYRTKNGKHFAHGSLSGIIRNEKYIGLYIFNKSAAKDVDGIRHGGSKDESEIIKVEGVVPPIISKETFQLAQEIIKKRVRGDSRKIPKHIYVLSGKIICGECHGAFIGHSRYAGRSKSLQVAYRCSVRKNKHMCVNKEVRREYIEKIALRKLAEIVYDEAFISQLVKVYGNYQLGKNAELVKRREDLKENIIQFSKEIDNLLILASKVSSEALANKLTELEHLKIQSEAEYQRLCNNNNLKEVTEDMIKDSFKIVKQLFEASDLRSCKKLIELYVEKVVIYRDEAIVLYRLHPDMVHSCYEILLNRSSGTLADTTSPNDCVGEPSEVVLRGSKRYSFTSSRKKLQIQVNNCVLQLFCTP